MVIYYATYYFLKRIKASEERRLYSETDFLNQMKDCVTGIIVSYKEFALVSDRLWVKS